MERESAKDEELQAVRHYIQNGNWDDCKLPSYAAIQTELCSIGYLVLRGSRIVVPKSLRESVLKLAHEGHQGITKTKLRLRSKVWWPKMEKDAERVCKSCHGCQMVGPYSAPEPMRVTPPTGPWQDLAVDLLGPLPNGEHILVVVDYYSRYYEVALMRNPTSEKVINAMLPMIARHGNPFSVKSDNGSQFRSEQFEDFLKENGIEHRYSPPLWPQANGEVERQNRSLVKTLKIAQIEKKNMRKELSKFLIAYRSTPHITTGETPAKLLFGREIKTKLPELRSDKSVLDENVREKEWEEKLKAKNYLDLQRGTKPSELKAGDFVLMKNEKKENKLSANFESSPVQIKRKEGSEIVVENERGEEKRRNSSFAKLYIPESKGDIPESKDDGNEVYERPVRKRDMPNKFKDYVLT
jgi:transposase InsO family protein